MGVAAVEQLWETGEGRGGEGRGGEGRGGEGDDRNRSQEK